MFLYKRKGVYYLKYFNEFEQKEKRVSTRKTTKKEAIEFISELKNTLKPKPVITQISLQDFEKEYMEYVKLRCAAEYVRTVQVSFNMLRQFTGNELINSFTYPLLDRFFSETYKRTKQGARTYHIALRSAFNKAVQWHYLPENPFAMIKLPKIPKNNPVFITETELNAILENVKNTALRDFYTFSFHTGMRLSEVINCKWSQVDLSEAIIRVTNTEEFTTKGKTERIVPINKTLMSLLQRIYPKVMDISRQQYIFNNHGFRYNADYISHKFKDAAVKSGFTKVHFHNLRHSFASNMVKRGVPIFSVKELLGHKAVQTTMIYSHLTVDSLKEAVKTLETNQ
ncbi:MAG TPA: tyrosine-type recombinase/integrase [Ignavibacteriales bacterium]|nr:tyrosine-type recombinase/integrase [Ignavibacteriales bacterium]